MQQNDKKIIAQYLFDLAKQSRTEFLEDAEIDDEIKEAAKKINLTLPNPDIAVFRTTWAKCDSSPNLNGVRLPRKVVEEGLNSLLFKQVNFEHKGAYNVCGVTIDAKIKDDRIETINIFYKSVYPDEFEELKEKIKNGEAAVSFEIWAIDPETKESVLKSLSDGTREFTKFLAHGTGLLLVSKPAEPSAKIFKLVAKNLTKEAEQVISNNVFDENLVYASLALENTENSSYQCECLNCGKIISSDKHCKDIKCPECGGDMRRKDRPSKGQPIKNTKKEETVDLLKLFENVKSEADITFDLAMAFYYASDEEQKALTEDAVKWTRKFINDLPDSAFAVIEPAYPEKTEDKNCRHLPHHNGEGDLGKEKSNRNLDITHYRNALARVNQIKPVTDSISVEDLRQKASEHLERHKDALKKSQGSEFSGETKTDVKTEETKTDAQTEQKSEEQVAETKAVETEVEETKENLQSEEISENKAIVKVTRIYKEITTDAYNDGPSSGTTDVKSYLKVITEYKDGTKDEVEREVEAREKFDYAEVVKKIAEAKEELLKLVDDKISELKQLQVECSTAKKLEVFEGANSEEMEVPELEVGKTETEEDDEIERQAENINRIIASKHKKR